ncbi:hypothetical protein QTN47_06315 [Danxiaibacter flavus]|uniref:Uncharacterized protein n=1 Tax=Danxiaibacter flavus TaxID=3049108 RepID=A0ABV3ZB51_9BACT|nr:hypothetical protein QNM32_06315 [Chitinophagaceae bacterium DXS]
MKVVIHLQLPSAFADACRLHQISPQQVIGHFFSYLSLYNYIDPSECLASLRATRVFHEFHLSRGQLQPQANSPSHALAAKNVADLIALINSNKPHATKRAMYLKIVDDWFNQINQPSINDDGTGIYA